MCYSATASFVSSAVIGLIGVATLRHVREPRALLFAAIPALFSLHQFTEGVVWLGLNGQIGTVARDRAIFLFMLYAQGILPLLMPAAVALMEPPGWRRRVIIGLTALGALVCGWMIYGLIFQPNYAFIEHHSVAYRNPLTGNLHVSILYIFATCGALLLSSHRVLRRMGLLNVVVLTVVELAMSYAFASVWCFYAAALSAMIYWQFRRQNIDIKAPHKITPPHCPATP